jgi:hypothetical protein
MTDNINKLITFYMELFIVDIDNRLGKLMLLSVTNGLKA